MSSADIASLKADLRQRLLQAVRTLDQAAKFSGSTAVCHRLRQSRMWDLAHTILGYAPMPDEVDVWPLLEEALHSGKRLALPYYDRQNHRYQPRWIEHPDRDLKLGWAGIREPADHCPPVALKALDLILVPGVGFDQCGRRLGRGKGFFDRLLSSTGGFKCGVGWDVQVCPEVPSEPHDINLDCILTPTQWLFAGHESARK